MSVPFVIGAVAYDPKVVTIWEGFRALFRERGLDNDVVLFTNYERQVEALLAGDLDTAWNSPLAWVRARRLAAAAGQTAHSLVMRDSDQDLTSLILVRTADAITSLPQLRGATIATGGERIGSTGNFFAPTLILDAPLDSDVFNTEPFGPMAALRSVKNLDEAIAEANRLPFGLSAYAFTSSIKNAHQLSTQVQTGMLWINQPAMPWAELPFGGVKDSGYGSEGGPEALDSYLNTKTVAMTSV